MKNQELVLITFKHHEVLLQARVLKHVATAIICPDKTVLATNTIVHVTGPRRNSADLKHTRQIFDYRENLNPLSLLRKPGDWNKPLDTRLSIVFAEPA